MGFLPTNPEKPPMAFKDTVQGFLDGVDLIAARLRQPMRALVGMLVVFQATYAAGGLDMMIPPGTKWAKWIGLAGVVIAYFTQRRGEPAALLQAKKTEAAQDAVIKP